MSEHVEDNDRKTGWKDQLSKDYKVVVLDEETLNQKRAFQGSLMRLIVLLGGLCLLVSILTAAFISFTPLKRLIPGYGDIEQNAKYLELRKQINELQEDFDEQQTYINGLQKIFQSDKKNIETLAKPPKEEPIKEQRQTQVISNADRESYKKARGLNAAYFTAPVIGSISSGFDPEKKHFGVDILAAKGTAIKSAAKGVVINSDWSLDAGNTISIQHPNNTITVYKHNSALLKKTGDYVSAGEAIAIIGNTGTLSDGPHLHFELWYHGVPTNPEHYITF